MFRPCFLKKQTILSRTILWPLFMKKKDLVPAVLIPSGIAVSKGASLNDVRAFLKILDPPPPCQMKSDLAGPP